MGVPPGAAQDNEGAMALGQDSGQQCASTPRASARHSTVNRIAAARVLVNAHLLLSDWDTLLHECAALIKKIGAPGRDSVWL